MEIVLLEHCTVAPTGYWKQWNSQFVVLDVIEWFSKHTCAGDNILLMDSDCLVIRKIPSNFIHRLEQEKVLIYDIGYGLDHIVNGLTRREMGALFFEYSGCELKTDFTYAGGEFICLNGAIVERVCEVARHAYNQSIERFKDGKTKFNEEAHLLSYVYHYLNVSNICDKFIKRIWTDRSNTHNIDGSEQELIVWHMPAEKNVGFIRLFNALVTNEQTDFSISKLATIFRLTPSIRDNLHMRTRRIIRRMYKGVFKK